MQDSIAIKCADNIRILSAAMVQKARSGHPGGAMGAADFITILFGEFLRFDPKDPAWIARDRYFQDPGHMSPLLYSILHFIGRLEMDDLRNFRQLGSRTPGHPELELHLGIENTSGPLGLGHAIALGAAIGERIMADRFGELFAHKTVALVSDGGIQEEIAYGVGRVAGQLALNNFILFYDANEVQLSCRTEDVMSRSVAGQYVAWGWKVLEINGNNPAEIRKALKDAWSEKEKPVLIIGHTVMGKGVRDAHGTLQEGQVSVHGQPLDAAGFSTAQTILAMGGNPEDAFHTFPEVRETFAHRLQDLAGLVADWKQQKSRWDKNHRELSQKLDSWLSNQPFPIDLSGVSQKTEAATRVHSGTILAHLAQLQSNLVCSSADLSNSDNTQSFLDKTGILRPGNFRGAFVQVGVAELTMASIANGLALHGGLRPVCATFFVFSDYMKPAMRIAALMGLPVVYLFTHDSFRVGEDGPTHQPIEHEAQVRLLEKLTGADGKPEMLVLRPADWAESTVAWEMALANLRSPTTLILTRQNVKALPTMVEPSNRLAEAAAMRKGAYVVSDNTKNSATPHLTLVANGSDVYLCHEAAEILRTQALQVRVVSMPSPRLFADQDVLWRGKIIPSFGAVLSISSGLPVVFEGVVGPLGRTLGLSRFGASGPFTVLEQKFGFTPEALVTSAKQYLQEYGELRKFLQAHLS